METIIKGVYEHYKGKRYQVFGLATHTETGEKMVVYKALYKGDFPEGALWIRPLTMFKENVTVNGQTLPRFRLLPISGSQNSWENVVQKFPHLLK